MTLSAQAQLVLSYGPISLSSGVFGAVAQEDGSYLFGFSEGSDTFPYPSTGHWYRSTNQGATWSAVTSTRGSIGVEQQFPANIHSNIVCAATASPSSQDGFIERSTDHGQNWTDVFHCASASSPNGRSVWVYGVQSFNRTHAITWGELDGNKNNPAQIIGLSTDAGATWTPQSTWDAGDHFDICNAIGVAEDGYVFAQYTKKGGTNRTSNFARSTNYASTWSVLTPPGGGTGTPPNYANAIACLDKNNIVMAGRLTTSPTASTPGVWWSDDAGTTLHLVPGSDIASWPSGSFTTNCREVKRLTRDAVLLCIDRSATSSGSPWRISLDKGQTYPIVISQAAPGAATYQLPIGKTVVTRDGHLLLPLYSSAANITANIQLWRAQVTC